MAVTQEQIDDLRLRTVSHTTKSFLFKTEPKPGVLKFVNIIVGQTYKINNPNLKINGRRIEVLNFIYPLKSKFDSETPLGIEIKFLDNNKKGTYYNIEDLEQV